MFRFMPLEGINAVLVITPQPKYLTQIETWLERLDLGGGEAGQRLYVYDVKNVKATDLATTLSDVFGGGGRGRATSHPPRSTLVPSLEPVEISTISANGDVTFTPPDAATKNQVYGGAGGTDDTVDDSGPVVDPSGGIALGAAEEVRVSAVEENNALLVRATAAQWESIRRVIERLDKIPLQVQIEAQIVRVVLNDALAYGVQWYFENAVPSQWANLARGRVWDAAQNRWVDQPGGRRIWGDVQGEFGRMEVNNEGAPVMLPMQWTFVGPSAQAVISALDKVSDLTVMSAPSLVVLNNRAAKVNVGTQLPVVSVQIDSPPVGTGGNNESVPKSYVQFRQTGITLNVKPRVNPGDLVFMEVEQEEDDPNFAAAQIGSNVQVNSRSIKTEIAVQSGETVLLGGLIRQIERKEKSGVPFLNRIPVLGALFGHHQDNVDREELLVLITPRVICPN